MDGPDYGRLKSSLANSKLQISNNAAYQTILGVIEGVQRFENFVSGALPASTFEQDLIAAIQVLINTAIAGVVQVIFIQPDTTTTPQTVTISDFAGMAYVVKDIAGNASANNITLSGTIDGVVDPTISTDFGVFRFFKGSDGLYHEW